MIAQNGSYGASNPFYIREVLLNLHENGQNYREYCS